MNPGHHLGDLQHGVGASVAPVAEADPVAVAGHPLELEDLGERLVIEQHRQLPCGGVAHRHCGLLGLGDVTP